MLIVPLLLLRLRTVDARQRHDRVIAVISFFGPRNRERGNGIFVARQLNVYDLRYLTAFGRVQERLLLREPLVSAT